MMFDEDIWPASTPPDTAEDTPARRTQVGALCWRLSKRRDGTKGPEILMVTSRDTGRWIIPKGWPIKTLGMPGSALLEAWEEGGVRGEACADPLGWFDYDKIGRKGAIIPCRVQVHAIKVAELAGRYPECLQRRRRWFRPHKAARKVAEPGLAQIMMQIHSGTILLGS